MGYPSAIQSLIDQFIKLPGVGERTAQRYVFFLLRSPQQELLKMAKLIMSLRDAVLTCQICQNYSERNPCSLCASPSRNSSLLCIVAYPHDVVAIEKTGEYRGLYHVLGGNINILEGVTPNKLKMKELIERLKNPAKKITEMILAFNSDLEGESTSLYLSKLLAPYPVKLTRPARGLPRGADIEYADEVTLGDAIKARREM